jgi:hypothetical protein
MMTNHMHVAGHFPEAYDGKLDRGGKEQSIAEIATDRELPPILKRFGDWAVTTEGIDCLTHSYHVGISGLDETDWDDHVSKKTWVNEGDFGMALDSARDMVRLGILKQPENGA